MILYLDTSTPTCHLWLDDTPFTYETNRTLARDLLSLILESIKIKSSSTQSVVAKTADLCPLGGCRRGVGSTPTSSRTTATATREDGLARVRALGDKESEVLRIESPENIPTTSQFSNIRLPKNSHIIKLLQRIRDESHRFAITYHTLLKTKHMLK